MKQKLWIAGAAVAVAVLAVGGLSWVGGLRNVAWAQDTGELGWLQGQVLEVDGETLVIETPDGPVEVLITDDTAFRVPGVTEPTLADLKIGTYVLVRIQEGEDGLPVARAVVVRPPRRLQENIVRGTVTEVSDDRFQVETAKEGTATLLITGRTVLWVPGEPLTTTVDLEVGAPVLAFGQPAPSEGDEKTISTRLVVVVSDEDLPKVLIQGQVVVTTRQTIVVGAQRGERAITVLPRTRLWSAEGRLNSLRDVRAGEQVVALGQPTEYGQWIAAVVFIPGPKPLARHGLRGEVTAVDAEASTLTVETDGRGEIVVVTGEDTRYRIPGVEEPALDDIHVGDKITALGRFEEGSRTRFLAWGIGVITPPDQGEKP